MARCTAQRTIGAMNKKILPLIVALGLGLTATASADKHGNGGDFNLTGKTVGFTKIDLGDPGDSVGDQQLFTMDVFQGTKRVGESHVVCTKVRVDATGSIAQCDNVTSLPAGQLTASEARVAKMAADGMTNREIAQALFLTEKTIEVHLTSSYRKLDIASRSQLPRALTPG